MVLLADDRFFLREQVPLSPAGAGIPILAPLLTIQWFHVQKLHNETEGESIFILEGPCVAGRDVNSGPFYFLGPPKGLFFQCQLLAADKNHLNRLFKGRMIVG